jgi:sporulation protein YlmC with PRC-barrel domain
MLHRHTGCRLRRPRLCAALESSSKEQSMTIETPIRPMSVKSSEGPGPRLMTASTLAGDDVVNRLNQKLGTVTEIMLDVPRGRIAYAVMAGGGFLGIGDKLFALPWTALTLDTARKCFVMDVDAARFDNAPGFDKDHWPSSADFDLLHEQIHSYWGSPRYWE